MGKYRQGRVLKTVSLHVTLRCLARSFDFRPLKYYMVHQGASSNVIVLFFSQQNIHVCLGGLFVPEAYITATRQYVAQANSWSLEELCLEVNVTTTQNAVLDACSFGVTG